jgi:hypothetical protein
MSWFIQSCKKLNNLLRPLRDLYKMKKFKPEQIHHNSWAQAKEALLDKKSGATRPLSTKPHDRIIVFTDSSHYGIGTVIMQKQYPRPTEVSHGSDPKGKNLYLVTYLTQTIISSRRYLPPWIKELESLYYTVKKYSTILQSRRWYNYGQIFTPQMTALFGKECTCPVLILNYLETRLQPADLPSRMCPDGKSGEYTKKFLDGKIINARGKDLDLKTLLCKEVSSTLKKYFSKNKRE